MRDQEKKTLKRARSLRRNMTRAEIILWQYLRSKQLGGYKFRRQVPIGPYIADFACVEVHLVVEVDGSTHSEPDEIRHDAIRTEFMRENGWHVHRVWNADVYENLTGVLDGILYQLSYAKHG